MNELKVDRAKLEEAISFAGEQLKDKPRTNAMFLQMVNASIILEPKTEEEGE
jgi:hypothetical protein